MDTTTNSTMIEQRTDLWDKQRLGKFTSSEIYKLMGAKGFGATGNTYIAEKAAETITQQKKTVLTAAMAWGTEYEPLAVRWFEQTFGWKVEPCPFIEHQTIKNYGGSPDGKFTHESEVRIIEVKCPFNSENHVKHIMASRVDKFKEDFKEYYWQMQSNMLITGAKACYFVSFDPRVNTSKGLVSYPIQAIESDQELIISRVNEANKILDEMLHELRDEEA